VRSPHVVDYRTRSADCQTNFGQKLSFLSALALVKNFLTLFGVVLKSCSADNNPMYPGNGSNQLPNQVHPEKSSYSREVTKFAKKNRWIDKTPESPGW
jgi:hypothetical protein